MTSETQASTEFYPPEDQRQLLTTLRHDLRTQLTHIMGYSQMLHDGVDPRSDSWGQAIPILAGARLTGRVGRGLDVGLLNIQTDEVAGVAASNNFIRQSGRGRNSRRSFRLRHWQRNANGRPDPRRALQM